jgi:hypothetical protein
MIKIEMTVDEANALLNLLDVAVKAGGIRIAPAALTIVQKIENSAKSENTNNADNS